MRFRIHLSSGETLTLDQHNRDIIFKALKNHEMTAEVKLPGGTTMLLVIAHVVGIEAV